MGRMREDEGRRGGGWINGVINGHDYLAKLAPLCASVRSDFSQWTLLSLVCALRTCVCALIGTCTRAQHSPFTPVPPTLSNLCMGSSHGNNARRVRRFFPEQPRYSPNTNTTITNTNIPILLRLFERYLPAGSNSNSSSVVVLQQLCSSYVVVFLVAKRLSSRLIALLYRHSILAMRYFIGISRLAIYETEQRYGTKKEEREEEEERGKKKEGRRKNIFHSEKLWLDGIVRGCLVNNWD